MPKLNPYRAKVTKEEREIVTVGIVPLTNHSGGKGPNWTLAPDQSPAGPGSIRFNNKESVENYFKRKYTEDAGYTVEFE